MSWFNLWDGLKTKTCRYLLQRYLGQFFENNLNLEQLKVDLYNGKAVVENISLKVKALNDLFEEQGWAFEVISGHIGCLTAMVPWNALMTNDSSLNISNLTITLRPVTRSQSGTTMLESMWSSVSSSMQMAEECMKQMDDDIPFLNHSNTLIGLEKFAETIDNVLNRIHANLTNTTVNIEYYLPKSSKQLIISLKADHIEYKNQTGYEKHTFSKEESHNKEGIDQVNTITSMPMLAKHNIVTYNLTIYTSEIADSENYIADFMSVASLCKIVEFKGRQNFNIIVKQTENIIGPKINLEVIIDDIYYMLTPRQTHLLLRILQSFNNVSGKEDLINNYSELKSKKSDSNFSRKMSEIVEHDTEWCSEEEVFKRLEMLYIDKKNKSNSIVSSTSANSLTTSCSNTQIFLGRDDKSGEILKFKLQICKIVGVFLHNDILFESSSNTIGPRCIYSNESLANYLDTATNFFQSTTMENITGECQNLIPNNNYLFIMVSSLLINGNQKRFCNELTLKTILSATMLDCSEILNNSNYPLIMFDRQKNCHEGYHTRPEITLSHTSSCLFKQNYSINSNKIECILDDCTAEFDISIYDRLNALFRTSPFLEDDEEYIGLECANPTDVNVKCNSLRLKLMIPVNDGFNRNNEQIPLSRKNLREDYLLFEMISFCLQCKSNIFVTIDEINGFFCNNATNSEIRMLHCLYQNSQSDSNEKNKISLKINFCVDETKIPLESGAKRKSKTPFSSKCSYGYSSHIEEFCDNSDKSDFILPGDTEEINEFCEHCKALSSVNIQISIPILKVILKSKKEYEVIYNRLNNDLLMWESKITSCVNEKINVFSFDFHVTEGSVLLYNAIQDEEYIEQLFPNGKMLFKLKQFRLFSVTGLNNDKDLGYFCIQLNEIDVSHCGLVFEDLNNVWTDNVDTNLIRILCNISKERRLNNNRREIISVVTEIKKQPKSRLKRIKLAFGINGANLWHKYELSKHHWINQLIDFLNIADYPIESYEPYALVSEIQGHLWNLAVEYRPNYFSYRALLDIGYCSFSSNIIYPMTGCTFRLICEDSVLSLGLKDNAANDVRAFITHINRTGLVPILNVGLINLSIYLSDQSKTHPSIDLRSSIHDVHLKTCYDGADVLAQLIAYIANDKDLNPNQNQNKTENVKDINTRPGGDEHHNNDETAMHINKLMADAVKDVNTLGKSQLLENSVEFGALENEKIQKDLSSTNPNDEMNSMGDLEINERINYYKYDNTENSIVQAELGATFFFNSEPVLEEKEYHVIHDEEIFFMENFGVEQVHVSEDPIQIVDNHFSIPSEKIDLLRPPSNFPIPAQSYTLCEMTFTWHLYGGKDFPEIEPRLADKTRFTNTAMSETYKHGVSQAPSKQQTKNKRFDDKFKTSRNTDVLVEIQLTKIRFAYDIYQNTSMYSSRQVLIISDVEIRDRLLSSDINKLLYHPNTNKILHKSGENIITIKALNVRPNVKKSKEEECSLKISILPIRLNIDQDTLLFLEEFFSALVKSSTKETTLVHKLECDNPNKEEPMMTVNETSSQLSDFQWKDEKDVDFDDSPSYSSHAMSSETFGKHEDNPIYFKEFMFSPALPICFDYHGRRVELSRGPITGLLMGLTQLQGSGICLREVINRRGILGWNKLFEFLSKEWLRDIKRNQLPNILSGIGPTNAVLQLMQGFFDLFRLPLEQYNKDGRIIRGFQLGAQSFTARTAFAALEITSRIIHLLQLTAETTFDILSAEPSRNRRRKAKHDRKRHGLPQDLREGVANAYTIVKEGINESANTLLEAAIVEHDQKGYSGAVGAVVRQIPQLVVCPAVLATQATTNILGGAKSSLVPEAKREATNKWKQSNY